MRSRAFPSSLGLHARSRFCDKGLLKEHRDLAQHRTPASPLRTTAQFIRAFQYLNFFHYALPANPFFPILIRGLITSTSSSTMSHQLLANKWVTASMGQYVGDDVWGINIFVTTFSLPATSRLFHHLSAADVVRLMLNTQIAIF